MIRVGICGYGNLGRGVESEILKNPDMELVAVFTRRQPADSLSIKANVPVVHVDSAAEWVDKIDVMILCGGSANDLPVQSVEFAKLFNTVDSFDTHAKIPEHLEKVNEAAVAAGNISIISVGWDPGMFSLMRLYMGAIMPSGKTYTFWGRGVSQGHSDAVRRVDGVANAIQYTVPIEEAVEAIRGGQMPELIARQKHKRVCYVVAKDGADLDKITHDIVTMPNYFDEYETEVNFITSDEFARDHGSLPHGGNVIRLGSTGKDSSHVAEFSIKLDSNPEFTASVLLAYARAAFKLKAKGEIGARTVFDIPPVLLAQEDAAEAIKTLL